MTLYSSNTRLNNFVAVTLKMFTNIEINWNRQIKTLTTPIIAAIKNTNSNIPPTLNNLSLLKRSFNRSRITHRCCSQIVLVLLLQFLLSLPALHYAISSWPQFHPSLQVVGDRLSSFSTTITPSLKGFGSFDAA